MKTRATSAVFLFAVLISIFQVLGTESPKDPKFGNLDAARILILGNSITLHGPAPEIGWTGNWGMAASSSNKDYVHLLAAAISTESGAEPTLKVRNIADFERQYSTYDVNKALADELEFAPQLVVIAIGENVPDLTTDDDKAKFSAAFRRLLEAIQQQKPQAIFVRSCFWPNVAKDEILKKESDKAGAIYVNIGKLGGDESNFARSERVIEHTGVAAHPGDQGMRAIADAILSAMKIRAGLTAKPENEQTIDSP